MKGVFQGFQQTESNCFISKPSLSPRALRMPHPRMKNPTPISGRSLHFTVANSSRVIIGFGEDSNHNMFNDIWQYENGKWVQIKTSLRGRNGCLACLEKNVLFLFGGEIKGKVTNTLMFVDLSTGKSDIIAGSGFIPFGRKEGSLSFYNNHLVLWGGNSITPLMTFDLFSKRWKSEICSIKGPDSLFCRVGNEIWNLEHNCFTVLDLETLHVRRVEFSATLPFDGAMCVGPRFLFYVTSSIYAYDLVENVWFLVADGSYEYEPRMTLFFDRSRRELMWMLGSSHNSVFSCSLGELLPSHNFEHDMLSMFHLRR